MMSAGGAETSSMGSPMAQSNYDCRKVFEQVIRADMKNIAQQIINNRWHKPTEENYELAKRLDNQVFVYLHERRAAVNEFETTVVDENGEEINYADWSGGTDDDDMDEDDWDA